MAVRQCHCEAKPKQSHKIRSDGDEIATVAFGNLAMTSSAKII
ncbi:MAG: hypothetical protein V1833_07325 [Elusimicrobiota bacterium]